jgi:hypothetical protein
MNLKDDILDELTGLSPLLAGIEKTNVFTVPDGYFNALDETILAGIKEDNAVLLKGFSKNNLFEAPNGYFENLSSAILGKIKQQQTAADELRDLSPMLYSIQNENVFEVPAGYFNTIPGIILDKVKPQPAKIVRMHKRRTFFKYASAAMIACILSLGVYKFINKPNHTVSGTLTFASLDPYIQKGIKMNAKQFDQTLDTLSQDDIANYLDKNGNDADVAELSSNIDDNSLPSQDQYLLDDKTLDNYLSDDSVNQKGN